jgi:hypothetical protein
MSDEAKKQTSLLDTPAVKTTFKCASSTLNAALVVMGTLFIANLADQKPSAPAAPQLEQR